MKKLTSLFILLPAIIFADYYYTAQSPLTWLNKNTGVRPAGMADAFTGLADDINAIFYNPAGLGTLQNEQLLLIHEQGVAEIFTETLALTHRLLGGNLAWTFQYNYAPDTQEIIGGSPQNVWDTYRNFLGSLSYGRNIYRWIHGGLTVKYARCSQLGQDFNVLMADIGFLFVVNLDRWIPNMNFSGLGITIQNIFPGFNYANKPADMDLKFRSGLALGYMNMMNLALEVEDSKDMIAQFRIGYEIFPIYFLALRCGYELNGQNGSPWDGFSVGAGIGNKTGHGALAFDVAARYRQSTGFTFDVGMNWTFNNPYYYTTIEEKINRFKQNDQEEQNQPEKLQQKQQETPQGPSEPQPDNTPSKDNNPSNDNGSNLDNNKSSSDNTQLTPTKNRGSSLKDSDTPDSSGNSDSNTKKQKKGSKLTD